MLPQVSAAHRAPLSCFRDVNVRGDRCGNCGWNGTHYTKCLEGNVLCGRVQCVNIQRVPVRQDGETVVQSLVNNQLCWGLEFHLDFDTPDEGSVKDGTSCGTNKVCNNKKNCHCDFGWAPPDCRAEGFGGSVDSGPPPSNRVYGAVVKAVGTLLVLVLISGVVLYKRADIAERIWR
ncbi:UNVERIFIED_CONTAM: hypothetical protein H355_008371 [Colinus virginianus]|nr:hypothetical protein H355_008371 [Colinus virginianus]